MKFIHYLIISLVLAFSFPLNSSFAISIPEENQVAKEFMTMIEKRQKILKDPVANHMIQEVGKHILSFLPPQPFDYSFYIVDDDVFNAFAGPGAHIFAYRGLITSLDSIDELAGIIGHEIAHAVSRHVAESIDRSKYISIGSLAGVLAGAVIGSQSDGKAGVTVMQGSMALGQTAMLAFTRENETEADEKGIMFLKQSCFSPEGLLSGLMKIRASDYQGVENIPDYVKTHPGTGDRIAHTETILSGYTPPADKAQCPEDFKFDMVKYRLMGLYGKIEPTFTLLTTRLEEANSNPETSGADRVDPAPIHYGLGLIYARKSRRDEALFHLKKALAVKIFDPMVLLEMGRIYLLNGEPEKALDVLTGLESDPILGLSARFHQADAHLELRHLATAESLLKTVIDKAPDLEPMAYFHLANIMSQEKKPGLSHFYLGLYYSQIDNPRTAVIHLKKSLESLDDEDKIKQANSLLSKLLKQSPKSTAQKAGLFQ